MFFKCIKLSVEFEKLFVEIKPILKKKIVICSVLEFRYVCDRVVLILIR